jgi:CheY-like chemotaxis protein
MKRTVVIVDDDGAIREVLGEILAEEGYTVLQAKNGREALALLRANAPASPCVVLLDLMMPEMDGAQFRRAQLADPVLEKIPVIILSADADVATKAQTMGVAAGLRKPIHLDEIVSTIATHCS